MLVLQIVLAIASTACLISFGTYMYLACRGGSPLLYTIASSHSDYTLKEKAFLILAAIGLTVCIFSGAESMLFWLPDSWGSFDEDGEFQTVRSILASLFTFGALAWVSFLTESSYKRDALDRISAEAIGLRKILEAQDSDAELEVLKNEFERKYGESLESSKQTGRAAETGGLIDPRNIQALMYRSLIDAVSAQQQRIAS